MRLVIIVINVIIIWHRIARKIRFVGAFFEVLLYILFCCDSAAAVSVHRFVWLATTEHAGLHAFAKSPYTSLWPILIRSNLMPAFWIDAGSVCTRVSGHNAIVLVYE